ncbi:hypothetical protein G647_05675 [Cladophialophora carrionii CBS 160.54]|uniref:FMN-dependent dehydrogenase domain-containing protein n=1 Tax=Cladophialophora carrionii CBS 160.54 TaxID=1279043 RepID=V9DC49_9EURO|nr:uncharacterized protein G647_05675 [Cladophialophora carrionii CBS 160.54]ETI23868.1 hypothetical protein G647_05675 [Cladophialophora carrionii CBS 160.54]
MRLPLTDIVTGLESSATYLLWTLPRRHGEVRYCSHLDSRLQRCVDWPTRGEVGTSKACAALNIVMGLSAYSNDSVEDVIKQTEGMTNPYAMQLSLLKSQRLTGAVAAKRQELGIMPILLPVDAPLPGGV